MRARAPPLRTGSPPSPARHFRPHRPRLRFPPRRCRIPPRLRPVPRRTAHPDRPSITAADPRPGVLLPGHNRRRFDAHLRFVAGEVVPWAGSSSARSKGPGSLPVSPTARGWAIAAAQRRRGPAADQPRGPFGRDPALPRGWHARAGFPREHPAVGGAAAAGRASLPSRGMDQRPRQPVVGAAVSRRTGLAARTVMSVPGQGQSRRRLPSVRSSARPDHTESAAKPRDRPGKPGAAAVIHISTGPFVHRFTGADLRLCPIYPQIYAQAVILAGQEAMGKQ